MNISEKQMSFVNRIVPPLTLWAVNRILTRPAVAQVSKRVDRQARQRKRRVVSVLRKARRNARESRTSLAVGATAVAVGVGLILNAVRPK